MLAQGVKGEGEEAVVSGHLSVAESQEQAGRASYICLPLSPDH